MVIKVKMELLRLQQRNNSLLKLLSYLFTAHAKINKQRRRRYAYFMDP